MLIRNVGPKVFPFVINQTLIHELKKKYSSDCGQEFLKCVYVCVDTDRVGNRTNHGPKFLLIINVYIYVSFLSPIWLPYGFWLFYLFPPLLLMHESAFAKPSFYIEGKSCKIQTHFQVNNSRLIFIEHLPCTRHSNKHFT